MEIQFGDIQKTALVTPAIRATEEARPCPRITDEKARRILDVPRGLIARHPDALRINLGRGFDDKFSQTGNERIECYDVDLPDRIAVLSW